MSCKCSQRGAVCRCVIPSCMCGTGKGSLGVLPAGAVRQQWLERHGACSSAPCPMSFLHLPPASWYVSPPLPLRSRPKEPTEAPLRCSGSPPRISASRLPPPREKQAGKGNASFARLKFRLTSLRGLKVRPSCPGQQYRRCWCQHHSFWPLPFFPLRWQWVWTMRAQPIVAALAEGGRQSQRIVTGKAPLTPAAAGWCLSLLCATQSGHGSSCGSSCCSTRLASQ